MIRKASLLSCDGWKCDLDFDVEELVGVDEKGWGRRSMKHPV
jgi:hypothetical protein